MEATASKYLSYDDYCPFTPKNERVKCIKIIDASTVHLGFILPPPYGPTYFVCKLVGITTPEIRSPQSTEKTLGRAARDLTVDMLLHKECTIRISSRDKYGRYLVRLATDECDDISNFLVESGVAKSLSDHRRPNWDELLTKYVRNKSKRTGDETKIDESPK